MKWLLAFIPVEKIIDYICDLAIAKLASKTETKIDDELINGPVRKFLKDLVNEYSSETTIKRSLGDLALNLIDFAGNDVKEELLEKLQDK